MTNVEAIIGAVLGVLAGLIGTVVSIKNTRGPRERRYIVGAAILVWGILVGVGAMAYFVLPFRPWVALALALLAVVGGVVVNRRQERIRREEGTR